LCTWEQQVNLTGLWVKAGVMPVSEPNSYFEIDIKSACISTFTLFVVFVLDINLIA
jgi:hypothetical protein